MQRLQLEVAEYKRKEQLWRERWQRIAFHIRQKGMQIHEIDQSISISGGGIDRERSE